MSLEIRFQQDSNSSPQYLSLNDGESLQVFSGECFQIQNPQVVAQLVPQANDLQIVCHDGSSYILKSFLDVQFSREPMLEIKDGTSITWHDFVQQSEDVDLTDIADDRYSQSLLFAPLHVIAMTSESQKWDLSQFPPESNEHGNKSETVSGETSQPHPKDTDFSLESLNTEKAPKLEESIVETKIDKKSIDSGSPIGSDSDKGEKDNALPYNTSTALDEIEIDVRNFIPSSGETGSTEEATITATTVGGNPKEFVVDAGTGMLRLPENIFDDDHQKKFIISIREKGVETETAITITQTKDGGGEVFHLILSHDRVTENNEGALIGKLDTDDSGQGHTYEYSILSDESGVFEIVGNVLKLKDGVSIDYEAQPDRYPLVIVSTDENGNRVEQTLSVWPEDVNEAASVASFGISSLEDVTVTFNPEDFENSFEDEDSDYLEMIRIDSLPDNGILLLGRERVTSGQLIDIDQVESLEFHPDVNWNGETDFTWSGFDGQSWSGESSPVNITIEAVNDAPVVNVNVGNETIATDTLFELTLPENAFTDADTGDALTYSADLPSWLEIDPETGNLKGTPDSESIGDHTVTITATDTSGESVSQTFQISVDQANRAPSITQIENQSVEEDNLFNLNVSDHFTDLDAGDTLTYTATLANGDPLPSWLIFNSESGALSGTPVNDDVGSIVVSVTASDGSESVSNSFTIDVTNTNDGPVVESSLLNETINEDAAYSLDVSENFSDSDLGDTLNYSASLENGDPLPEWLSIDASSGKLSGTPENADVGSIQIFVTASDSEASTTDSFSLTVENTNDGPVVTHSIESQAASEDATFSLATSGNFSDEDFGDTLSFSATLENGDPLPGWMTIDSETGELSGVPRNGDVGQVSITVTASDGEASASSTFDLTIENTNDGPTVAANISNRNTLEDELFTVDTSSNFSDQDIGDTLTYSATLENGDPLPDWLTIDADTGVISGTPENADVGKISITVTASDGSASTTDSFSLTVFNTNDAPLVNWLNENQPIEEDASFNLDASVCFEDVDVGDVLTFSATQENGDHLPDWLQINSSTGELFGTPENGDVGEFSLTLSASDGEATTSKTFSLYVENTNDGPVVTSNIADQTIDEDASFNLDVSVNFADEDLGGPLTYSATLENGDPLPSWIRIDSETGEISGTPRNSDVGKVSIKVTASDGIAQASDSFELTVENGNDGPVVTAAIADQSIEEDASFSLDVSSNFSDGDIGDILTYSATLENGDPLPDWLSVDPDTGLITGIPENEDVGDISITVTASGGEAEISDSFALSVENTNDGPRVTSSIGDRNTSQDGTFTLDTSDHFEDEDLGDSLSYSATLENGNPLPNWISINSETGELTGSPQNSNTGDLNIKITVSDGEANVDQSFTLSVGNTNDGPTLSAAIDDQSTDEDSLFTLDISQNFNDIDIDDELVFEATLENGDPLPDWLTFDENTGLFSGHPTNEDVGDLSITVLASDGESIATDTFGISVENTNDGPIVSTSISDQTTGEDAAFSLDVSGNFDDQDLGDTLTYSATLENGYPLPDWVSIDPDTGEISGTPENGDVGSLSITVTAADESGETASDTFGIQVDNTNDGPTATAISDQTTGEDAAFSLDVSGNFDDKDLGDTLTYSATLENGDPLPDWVSIDSDTGEISGTPENGDVGSISVTVTATDDSGETATGTFGIQVDNTNDGPTATAISDQATDEDSTFSLDVSSNFSDADVGDSLTFSATLENGDPLPSWVSIDTDTGEISGTPENGDVGSISVNVTATDGSGATASDTFGIQVDNTNDGPTATAISNQTTDEDYAFSLDVSGNFSDADVGDSLTFSATLENGDPLPSWVSIDSDTGELSGTPENGNVGSISVTVTASDGEASASDTFTLTVENANDGPTVSTSIADTTTDEDAAFSLDVSGNFADEDMGDTLTFSATLENGDPLPDWLSIDADTGELSGTPENGDVGGISVTVTASDGEASASDTFNVTVENTNDGPTVVSGGLSSSFAPQDATLISEINFDSGIPTASQGSLSSEASGMVGDAADFSNAQLSVENIDLPSGDGEQTTVSMWIQANPSGSWEMLVASDRHDLVMLDGNIGFNTSQGDHFGTDASELADGQWHHVVATFTNGDVTQNSIHIDGVGQSLSQLQGTPSSAHANIDSDGGTLHFGGWGYGTGYTFTGSMDEIKVYNGSLSQEEISQLHEIESAHTHWENAGLSNSEDAAFSLDTSVAFADEDEGDELTFSATLENGDPLPDWLSIDEDSGLLSGTPENGDVGNLSLTVTASDGEASASDTFTLTVENTNDGPIVSAIIADQTTDEDAAFYLDVTSNFADEDLGDTLTYNATLESGDTLPGWLSIDPDTGELSGMPENGDVGDISVTVTASDGEASVSDTFTLTVENTNDGPVVIGGFSSPFEPQDATLISEINFDSGIPTASQGSLSSEASGMVGDAADFSNAQLSVDGMDLPGGAGEQTTVSMWIQADPSGSWEMLAASKHYDLVLKDGNIGFNTAGSDLFGTDASELADGQWHHVVATFTNGDVSQNTVSIDGVDQTMSQIQGTPSSSNANINSDGGTLHFGGWGGGSGYGFTGSMDEVKVFHGKLSQEEIVQLNEIESGHERWENAGLDASEDSVFSLDASEVFYDEDLGDTLAYSATLENGDPLPDWLSIDPVSGVLSGTPENGDAAELSITVTASDGEASAADTFSLSVANTNDGPVVSASIADQTTSEDAAFSLDLSGNFADEDLGDTLAYSATLENGDPLPAWLSLDPVTGLISGTPENGDVGDISVTVTASDGEASAVDTFSISVENVNDAPVVSYSENQTIWEEDFSGLSNGTKSDSGDSAWTTDESSTSVSPTHGVSNGAYEFSRTTTTANDDTALLKLQTETIDISGRTDLELSFDLKTEGGMEESGSMYDLFQVIAIVDGIEHEIHQQDGNHVDGDGVFHTISLSNIPEGDSLVLSFEGKTTVTSEKFSLDNIRLNGNSVGIQDEAALEDSLFTLDLSERFSDDDLGDTLSYSATLENGDPLPSWLTFYPDTGIISGTPNDDDVGSFSVSVAASDGQVGASATFSITVVDSNIGPVANVDTADVTEPNTVEIDVLANDTDANGDVLTITSATVPSGQGSVSIVGNKIVYDPGNDFSDLAMDDTSPVVITYTIDDGDGGTSTSTATVTVTGDDDLIVGSDSSTTVTGTDNANTIDGGAGHDTIYGEGGDDTIIGGTGNDNLYGGGGDDTFEVSEGDGWDNFDGGDGNDTVVSTDGVDIQIDGHLTAADSIENISAGGHAGVRIAGDASSQTIDLSGTTLDGIDAIDGGAGHDTIVGSEGDDTIIGGTGNDNLYGGGGDDTFEVSEGDGWDNFDGGDGNDTVVSTDGVDIQIDGHLTAADSIENISAGGHAGVRIAGDASSQTIDLSGTTLDGIDAIDGGAGHDTIVGSEGDDTIVGGTGNDNLYGGGGDDTFEVSEGDGWDNFDGGDGNDTVVSTDGVDIQIDGHLTAADSIENISAGGHAGVRIAGDASSQTIDLSGTTLDGIDAIDGGAGHDTIVGSEGDDTIVGGTGNDNLYGGGGDDTFLVSEGDGADDFYGGDGTDTVKATGDNVDITIDGHFSPTNSIENISADGYSNVTVSGDSSSQTLDFSGTNLDGISAIDGGAGHDTITGTESDDNIIGGSGNDTINAGTGNDTIDATEGSNNVDAGSGDDTITVGDNFLSGGDVDGGEGEDALVFDGADLYIDLSSLDAGALQNIEHINIDGSGSNNLRLSAEDVLNVTDGDNRLFIDGGSDDSVEISADYSNQGTETIGGVDYSHYYDVGTDSHLYINNDITDLNTF